MAKNALCTWDFTLKQNDLQQEDIRKGLKPLCKSYCFQLEKGSKKGLIHFQGRVSFKLKTRKPPLLFPGIHWSPTSTDNKDNTFYVMKEDTRIDGPWSDKDPVIYLPKQFRNIKLYKWQKDVLDSADVFEPRKINLIYDQEGNSGKSTIASICEILHNGIDMPPLNDFKELVALTCDICMERDTRTPKIIFFDLPRALDKDRLNGLYSAIEQIKKGKLYDCRYKYKSWWIDSPQCWVFSNHLPDTNMLSIDRWNIYTIDKVNNMLARFVAAKPVTLTKRLL